jgi:hypothetical protein
MAIGAGAGDVTMGAGLIETGVGAGPGTGMGEGIGGTITGGVVIIATVFGAGAGLASITLGLGFCDARPTPISIRFESSSSSGHGWRLVKVDTCLRTGTKAMIPHAMSRPRARLANSRTITFSQKKLFPACASVETWARPGLYF